MAKKLGFCARPDLSWGWRMLKWPKCDLSTTKPITGFAVIICRAFSEAIAFWDGALPLLAKGGLAIAMKGRRDEAELAALTQAGVSWEIQDLTVPGLKAERHLLLMHSAMRAQG